MTLSRSTRFPLSEAARALCTRLGIFHPLIQAPMGGGASTPEMAAAVSNAGGLGSLGCSYLTPEQIHAAIGQVRSLTDRPFNVNLFAGGYGAPAPGFDPEPALAVVRRHHAALGLPEPKLPLPAANPFAEQLEPILEARVPVFSFTFGIPPADALARVKRTGAAIFGTATTVEEARRLAAAGVDAVVAQGSEAGAHRGTFAEPTESRVRGRPDIFEAAMIGTMALVPLIASALGRDTPVIASGGIMDGRGIAAAMVLGAAAVQLGTAFLATDESGIPEVHKALLLTAAESETFVTRAFSGRPARAIRNSFITEVEAAGSIPPFPQQNTLTRGMRSEAAKRGDAERLSLWAGQGARLARRTTAARLVTLLEEEAEAALRGVTAPVKEVAPRVAAIVQR